MTRAPHAYDSLRRLARPRPVQVEVADGAPVRIGGRCVAAVRERWIVEEGWWTDAPVRRDYAEVVLDDGRLAVVFADRVQGGWQLQQPSTPPIGGPGGSTSTRA